MAAKDRKEEKRTSEAKEWRHHLLHNKGTTTWARTTKPRMENAEGGLHTAVGEIACKARQVKYVINVGSNIIERCM